LGEGVVKQAVPETGRKPARNRALPGPPARARAVTRGLRPIHLLSISALATLPLGLWYARRHNVRGHKLTMLGLFGGALLVAGPFTLAPGRLMHRVVFGG